MRAIIEIFFEGKPINIIVLNGEMWLRAYETYPMLDYKSSDDFLKMVSLDYKDTSKNLLTKYFLTDKCFNEELYMYVNIKGIIDLILKNRRQMNKLLLLCEYLAIDIKKEKQLLHEREINSAHLMTVFEDEKYEVMYVIDDYLIDLYFTEYELGVMFSNNYDDEEEVENKKNVFYEQNVNLLFFNITDVSFDIFTCINKIRTTIKIISYNYLEGII